MGTRVYLGRLSYQTRERDVERFFRGYGRVREIMLKNGYGFVEFDDPRDSDDAVYELNGKELLGERVTVEFARGKPRGDDYRRDRDRGHYDPPRRRSGGGGRDKYGPPTRTDYRLLVENLSSRVSWQDLKDYMRQAGEITYADAHRPHRGEGVVEFSSYSDMKKALEKLDDTEINGRRIRLVEDKPRSRSKRSHSRSRSRSRSPLSRSRSRSRSRSAHGKSRSRSRSKSRSKSRGVSRSKSRSRSKSPRPRSQSRSPEREVDNNSDREEKNDY